MELPELVDDLRTASSPARGPRTGHTKKVHAPLPINPEAVEQEARTYATIGWWCQLVVHTWCPQTPIGAWCPVCDHASCVVGRVFTIPERFPAKCSWLSRHASAIGRLDNADEFYEDMTVLRALLRGHVDRPGARRFLGLCRTNGCDGPLLATPGARWVRCRVCDTAQTVTDLEAGLVATVRVQLLTVRELTTALPRISGHYVSANTIKTWKRREVLQVRGRDSRGRQVFLAGDVLDLIKRGERE